MRVLTSDEIFEQITQMVKTSEESLKIASAWIKGKLFDEIIDLAKEKKLHVEIILRASEFQDMIITDEKVFKKIKESGGKIYLCNRLHAKFIIADDKKAVVGSANFTEPGLSDLSIGNIEAGVYYDSLDLHEEINKLVHYFDQIKKNFSYEFGIDLIGFTLNPVHSHSFEFILADEELNERSYVEIRPKNGKVLARIKKIYSYNMGFFANPFTSNESNVLAPLEDFKKIFSEEKDWEWKKAAIYAYLSGSGNRMKIASAEIVGIMKDGRLETVKGPFDVGEPVYRVSEESIESVMKKNFSGKDMVLPVKVGLLEDSAVEVFIDAEEIVRRHMLIIGTTGSGKSHFAKIFLSRVSREEKGVQVFVFDPHGEYFGDLSNHLGGNDLMEHIVFKDTLFPVRPEEVIDLIKDSGFAALVSGNAKHVRENISKISREIKPSLKLTGLSSQKLLDVISSLSTGDYDVDIEEVAKSLKSFFGSEILSNQPETVEMIKSGLNSEKRIVIFDFKQVSDPQTRVNIAGLIMLELFNKNREEMKKRIIVLEEAHNFAPERGYGDVSAGGENLALRMARKIASEGRKFNTGLITITQRPAQVSKYVLSQMNTQAMFKTINATDLDTIATYIEYTGKEIINTLPSLPTGTGVLCGIGVPFPILVQVEN